MVASTTAPIIDIEIAGKTRKLFMGFRACKKIGLNPYNKGDIEKYMGALDIDKAVEFILAGIENASNKLKDSESQPTVEEVVDSLDAYLFLEIVKRALDGDETQSQAQPAPNGVALPNHLPV